MPHTILYQDSPKQDHLLPAPTVTPRRTQMGRVTHAAHRTQLRLTLRDVAVLEDIYTSRYMTAPQIQALHWRENRGGHIGQRRACQRRMQLLFHRALVRRIEPLIRYSEGKKPLIYAL